jgi:hypothetical protein
MGIRFDLLISDRLLVCVRRQPSQCAEPTPEQRGMGAETLVDFCPDPTAIHVDREIAIAVDLHRSVRVFV